jgi:hypothetical protein
MPRWLSIAVKANLLLEAGLAGRVFWLLLHGVVHSTEFLTLGIVQSAGFLAGACAWVWTITRRIEIRGRVAFDMLWTWLGIASCIPAIAQLSHVIYYAR